MGIHGGLTRRQLLIALGLLAGFSVQLGAAAELNLNRDQQAAQALAQLEAERGGVLGVYIFNPVTGAGVGHNQALRFGMCSTFKLALAGVILAEIDAGRLRGDQRVPFDEDNMVFYAPVTEMHLEQGWMTVLDLAEATQTTSDNVAANLLLDLIGGPAGFTEKLRAMGDADTRLDRYEPEMNLVPRGELRDTTTPQAMAHTVARLTLEDVLSPDSRQLLINWAKATRTGLKRLRAGFPEHWPAGDKTGTGIGDSMANKYNDIAVAWSPEHGPLVVTAYYEADGHYERIRPEDQAVLAEVGRIAAEWYMAAE